MKIAVISEGYDPKTTIAGQYSLRPLCFTLKNGATGKKLKTQIQQETNLLTLPAWDLSDKENGYEFLKQAREHIRGSGDCPVVLIKIYNPSVKATDVYNELQNDFPSHGFIYWLDKRIQNPEQFLKSYRGYPPDGQRITFDHHVNFIGVYLEDELYTYNDQQNERFRQDYLKYPDRAIIDVDDVERGMREYIRDGYISPSKMVKLFKIKVTTLNAGKPESVQDGGMELESEGDLPEAGEQQNVQIPEGNSIASLLNQNMNSDIVPQNADQAVQSYQNNNQNNFHNPEESKDPEDDMADEHH
ncbi:hypothetical protein [Pararcticibacter amylolyticus]|uniref:Uncharacterized protein n=1 Tax=Pararcticibacter amylolyticus TaxID=2173175 RepID=A0A2U2PB30_9SPHI|nr:hypothetical protein [Pararcticibacter amylolyticus]PWG78592.1 hypothetical protein DDR33_21760 [Pararcticibacter amylolyticus]